MKRYSRNRKAGGICLEAALVMPVVMLLILSVVLRIVAAESSIRIKGALDRTASELSLILCLCDLYQSCETGRDLEDAAQSMDDGLAGLLGDDLIADAVKDLALDMASSVMLSPLICERFEQWLDLADDGLSSWRRLTGDYCLYLDWDVDHNSLWLSMSYVFKTPFGEMPQSIKSVVPIWSGSVRDDDKTYAGEVWLLDNFTRGRMIRSAFGGNLPFDFPVIAAFAGGTAVSIKSMDLTAPSYADNGAVRERVNSLITDLASFSGTRYVRDKTNIEIAPGDILARKLLLIIPENYDQERLQPVLTQLQQHAFNVGIVMEVHPYGESTRYSQQDS